MLGFFKFSSMAGALLGGLALVGAFGGCGPASGTCSADKHTILDVNNTVVATCKPTEACNSGGQCAPCDSTLCLPKNSCVLGWSNLDDVTKGDKSTQTTACRITCTSQDDCPFDYHCVPGDGVNYCAKDRIPSYLGGADFKPTTVGEAAAGAPWGVPCDPQQGLDSNPTCDTAQSFWCYGISNTDANAYCTQYQCKDDGDCPGGWWCGTINDTPDVRNLKRKDFGPPGASTGTTSLCMPRAYNLKPGTFCATCKTDLDCPKNEGNAQHCISADNNGGSEKTCGVECTNDGNCPLDYACQASDDAGGANVCVPRAGTCTGNAAFCSPCHSDTDCDAVSGYCVIADYSTEHYCTTLSGVPCSVSGSTLTAKCPTTSGTPSSAGVSCSYSSAFQFPKDQCYGLVNFGTGSNAAQVGGCWTKHPN